MAREITSSHASASRNTVLDPPIADALILLGFGTSHSNRVILGKMGVMGIPNGMGITLDNRWENVTLLLDGVMPLHSPSGLHPFDCIEQHTRCWWWWWCGGTCERIYSHILSSRSSHTYKVAPQIICHSAILPTSGNGSAPKMGLFVIALSPASS